MEGRITYNFGGRKGAIDLLSGINMLHEGNMRSWVAHITGNSNYASNLDYISLRREVHKIKGVARKILGERETRVVRDETVGEQLTFGFRH